MLTATEDIANARLQFQSGAVANLTASRVSKDKTRKIRIFQRDAYVSVDCMNGEAEMYTRGDLSALPDLAVAVENGAARDQAQALARLITRVPLAVEPRNALADELAAFVAAVRGERAPEPDGHAGREALALALSIRERIQVSVRHLSGAFSPA